MSRGTGGQSLGTANELADSTARMEPLSPPYLKQFSDSIFTLHFPLANGTSYSLTTTCSPS